MTHLDWMQQAFEQACIAERNGEVPIGAVIIANGAIIAKNHNQTITQKDPTAHAEILCIRQACLAQDNHRLKDTTLYITLEPCIMCYGAIIQSRVSHIIYGASDAKNGVFSQPERTKTLSLNHHPTHLGGVMEAACREQLRAFFQKKR